MANLHTSPYIFGIHDPGGEHHMAEMGRKGWIVFTEVLGIDPNDRSGSDYSRWANDGYGVIVRLNNGYNPAGTIPHPDQYENFARRCANFAGASRGAHIWIIGNEMNYRVEWPGAFGVRGELPPTRDLDADPETVHGELRALSQRFSALHPAPEGHPPQTRGEMGDPITPEKYVRCYTLCRDAIRRVSGHEQDQVLVGAVAPWNVDTQYPENPSGDWVRYFADILTRLGPSNCDGIAMHTYTHGTDPNLIHDASKMDPPFQDRHYHFFTYRDFMHAIPQNMRHLPVYLTEMDQDHAWENINNGWIQRAYGEIDWWNQQPNHQQICAAVLYRWPKKDKWYIEGKAGVIEDFRQAMQNEYRWKPDAVHAPGSGPVLPPEPLPPADFAAGDQVFTATVVNLRKTPGVTGKGADDIVVELPAGTPSTVIDGPKTVDNLVWWRVRSRIRDRQVEGWSAQAVSADRTLLTKERPQSGPFAHGDAIYTLDTVRLRRTPGFRDKPADDVLAELPLDVRATVVDGPRQVDGLTWWRVQSRVGSERAEGWLAETAPNGAPLLKKAGETQPIAPRGKFEKGQTVYTSTFVNLRQTPGYVDKTPDDIVIEMPHGAAATVEGGPESADDLTWWRLAYTGANRNGHEGWTTEAGPDGRELLVIEAPPPPKPIEPPPFQTYEIGASVCNIALVDVNVRKTPGFRDKPADDVVALVPSKALLRLVDGPRAADDLHWWRVQGAQDGETIEGWMAEVSPNGIRLLAPALYRDAIRLSVPFDGNHRVSQLWGDNADFYRQFTYDGVPLRGHNGIDFAMPVGTPLLAADGGTVKTVGSSPAGFGNWVMVDHRWGHSVYAHMHRITVREGQPVQRGDRLGESGNSGTSTGPHLHFSIRINPYFRGDGWGGYCDPLPFMNASELNIPAGVRGEGEETLPPSPPPIEEPGRPLP